MNAAILIHPDFANGLTNHAPMVVSALREVGATRAHIDKYQAMMAEKAHPVSALAEEVADDAALMQLAGKRENYAGIHAYLTRQCLHHGHRTLVNTYVPQLADGLSAVAFHALIRLGHAVFDDDATEVVTALAYWVWANQALPFPEADTSPNGDPATIMAQLLDGTEWPEARFDTGLIYEEFDAVTQHPTYSSLRFRVAEQRLSYSALADLAIQLLWMHDDFTLLHGVTGVTAARRISTWLDDPDCLLQPMWKGLVIAFLSKGLRWLPTAEPSSKPSLSVMQIKTLAAHSMRDHTVKLVAACLENYRRSKNELFLHVAEREIRNDDQLKMML